MFLAEYARASQDYDLYGVIDFYESYRAFVRGKVSAIVATDESAPAAARARAAEQARKYYLLAEACAREPVERPVVYAVGGMIASGKSSVADALGSVVQGPVVDADRTRKHLAGVAATEPLRDGAFDGRYSAAQTDEVYAEVLRRAETVLTSRRPVVLDASFRDHRNRALARALAHQCGAAFVFIECRVDLDTSRARLERRARGPSVSDGRIEVLDAFAASYEPVTELTAEEHVVLDTSGSFDETLASLRARLGV